jgi:RNA polymerase sigma-70 factor (sigma-E family)
MMRAEVRREPETRAEGGRLGELYAAHAGEAVRLAYLLTGNRALAEDLAQEAFVRLFGRFRDLRQAEAFRAYLRTTVVNLSRSHFRRVKVERAFLARAAAEPAPAGSDPHERGEMWEALGTLTPRQRAAIVLRYYEDLTEAQTADVLRCPVGTVKSLVSRGTERLRRELERGA